MIATPLFFFDIFLCFFVLKLIIEHTQLIYQGKTSRQKRKEQREKKLEMDEKKIKEIKEIESNLSELNN